MMVLAALPMTAVNSFALTDGDWEYTVNNNEATVTGYTGIFSDIVIPSTLGGYPVTEIGNSAFNGNTTLRSIVIPNTVTTISNNVFQNCSNLETASLGNSVSTIGGYAFSGCSAMTRINIPASVTRIDSYAFYGCNSLSTYITNVGAWCGINFNNGSGQYYSNPMETGHKLYINSVEAENIVIPNGVTSISTGAFDGCYSVKSIVIPEGVTTINSYMFRNCKNLESISIPSTLTSVSSTSVFQNCNAIKEVHISDVGAWCNISFPNNSSNPLTIAKNLYLGNNLITDLVIPNTVTTIKPYVFYNGTCFTSVSIPSSVTTFQSDCFRACSNLTALYITDLEAWCDNSFVNQETNPLYYAHNLYVNGVQSTITIPSTVTQIKQYAFSGLANDVVIPGTVTDIGAYSFFYGNMTSTILQEGVQVVRSHAFDGCSSMTSITIPTTLTTTENYAFNGCSSLGTYITDLEAWCNITFGDGGGYYANPLETGGRFYLNNQLVTDLVIPNTITQMKYCLFMGCTSIKSVTIPEGVTSIGRLDFYNCKNLESITIPSTLTSIHNDRVFAYCNKLNAVHISDIEAWCNIPFPNDSSNPLYYAKNLYLGNDLITDLVIPDTVTTIKPYTFYNGTCFKSVTLPEGLTTIGNNSFSNCSNLESITIPSTLVTCQNDCFSGCSKLNAVYITDLEAWCNITFNNLSANPLYSAHNLYVNGVQSTLTIPSTVTQIKQYSFAGLANDVIIPGNVTEIGSHAFYTGKLTSAVLQEGVQTIRSNAFYACSLMTSISIPSSLTKTENYAFSGCSNLSTYITDIDAWCRITFGDSGGYYANPLETGHKLYLNNELVTDLVIPDTVTEIKYCAFMGCSPLKSVTIPEGVTKIGRLAFYYCTGLESITIPSTLAEIHDDRVFQNCNALKEVHISDVAAWCAVSFPNNSSNPLYYAGNLYLGDNLITELVIPKTVTTIKQYVFYNAKCLTKVTISDGATSIGYNAFANCTGLKYLALPDSITSINSTALQNCNNIEKIFCHFNSWAATYNPSKTMYLGDMNIDGVIDTLDLDDVISVASGNTVLSDEVLEIVADYNLDGVIDGFDAAEMDRDAYGHNSAKGDINEDGEINATDYAMVKEYVKCTADLLDKSYLTAEYDSIKDNYSDGIIITQQYYRADYDGDKSVDAFDLYYLDSRINSLI